MSEPCFNPAYFKLFSCLNSNRTLSASVLLTAITPIHTLKPSRKLKCYVSTDTCTGQQPKAESGTCCRNNHFYERPGYEATFLTTLE